MIPAETRLFILAGQSNMAGLGLLSELPDGLAAGDRHIYRYDPEAGWEPAAEPIHRDTARPPGVGPGLAFAKALRDRPDAPPIGLVPCARDGTAIDDWLGAAGSETPYGIALARARAAAGQMPIAGVAFYQGESDAADAEAARLWPAKFARLVANFRRDLGRPALPIVFAQIGPIAPALGRSPGAPFAAWDDLRNAQARVSLPGVRMIRTADAALGPDGLHLATAGAIVIGKRLGRAMKRLMDEAG